mmetsp:Transcript_28109/g.64864  ORF Transcript_28109/g.64864 Transcript_28109/m.64864 type:complete len:172 (-) Transcript_28109:8-523(-)
MQQDPGRSRPPGGLGANDPRDQELASLCEYPASVPFSTNTVLQHHSSILEEMEEVAREHPELEQHLIGGVWTYMDVNLSPIGKMHYDKNDNTQVPAVIMSFGTATLRLPHVNITADQRRGSMIMVNSFKYQHGLEDTVDNRRSIVLSAHNAFRMATNRHLIEAFIREQQQA